MGERTDTLVVGLGNDSRGDDACGLAVARAIARRAPEGVRVEECQGDVTGLIDLWQGVHLVVAVDAMRSSFAPGTILRSEVLEPGFEGNPAPSSTHGLSLVDAVGLGKALGKMPARLVLYTIGASEVSMGIGLSREVTLAVPLVVQRVLDEISQGTPGHRGPLQGGRAHA